MPPDAWKLGLLACLVFARDASSTELPDANSSIAACSPESTTNCTLNPDNICNLVECTCTNGVHPVWKIVNCTFGHYQSVELSRGSLPAAASEVSLAGARAVHLNAQLFSDARYLRSVALRGVGLVRVRKHAFLNLTSKSTSIEVTRCGSLFFENKSFAHTLGPLHVNISLVEDVLVQGESFSWLLSFFIKDVPRLELAPGAFLAEPRATGPIARQGTVTKIHMVNVLVPEFPRRAFGSPAAEVRLDRVEVRAIRGDAFSALTLGAFVARRCAFHRIESGAFAAKMLVDRILIHESHLLDVASGAFLSGISNLTLHGSRFAQLAPGAINITVVTATIIGNQFLDMHENAIVLQSWNRLNIERNSFDYMEANAISAPLTIMGESVKYEMTFIENEMNKIAVNSLRFLGDNFKTERLDVKYDKNYFGQLCHCKINTWLSGVFGNTPDTMAKSIMEHSYCTINAFFAKCFNLVEGNILMKNFSDRVCNLGPNILCESIKQQVEGATEVIKNTRFPQRMVEKTNKIMPINNTHILVLILIVAVLATLVIILILVGAYIKRKGCCNHCRNTATFSHFSLSSCIDKYFGINNGVDRTRSISRLSINEYRERNQLNDRRLVEADDDEINENNEFLTPTEHKGTQTLPEELTKELLESLKKKLNDPEKYSEARDKIEYLYELIKFEETSNNNPGEQRLTIIDDDTDNLYDVILPPTAKQLTRKNNVKKNITMVSVGTKVPSFENIYETSPYYGKTALCHEYFEPRDFAQHLYDEVIFKRKNVEKPVKRSTDVITEQEPPRGPFLRAIMEKINALNNDEKPKEIRNHILKDTVELLPMSDQESSSSKTTVSSGKMSNRPLPKKPTETNDPGEGTSGVKW